MGMMRFDYSAASLLLPSLHSHSKSQRFLELSRSTIHLLCVFLKLYQTEWNRVDYGLSVSVRTNCNVHD
jgi:hypothetical protein